jgi:ribosomal protein L11 methyltransferase
LRSILFKPGLEPEQLDLLIASLWERGTSGVLEEEDGVRAFFADADAAAAALADYPEWIVETREEHGTDVHVSALDCDPVLIGKRFFVVPPSSPHPTPPGRIRLGLDATMAFGTGRHESTQLAIEALETHMRPGATVLDVGCGSGILSLAASALGARRVVSCDVHPHAISTAAQYLGGSPLFCGTIDAVRDHAADLVIANISARVIDLLAPDLNRITRPDGILMLAGFIEHRTPTRFAPEKVFQKNDWLCWISRPDASRSGAEAQQPQVHRFAENWW